MASESEKLAQQLGQAGEIDNFRESFSQTLEDADYSEERIREVGNVPKVSKTETINKALQTLVKGGVALKQQYDESLMQKSLAEANSALYEKMRTLRTCLLYTSPSPRD